MCLMHKIALVLSNPGVLGLSWSFTGIRTVYPFIVTNQSGPYYLLGMNKMSGQDGSPLPSHLCGIIVGSLFPAAFDLFVHDSHRFLQVIPFVNEDHDTLVLAVPVGYRHGLEIPVGTGIDPIGTANLDLEASHDKFPE